MKQIIKSTAKGVCITICIAVAIGVVDIAFELISSSSTLLNLIGLAVLCVVILITIKTKIFTIFKSNNNEKNN